MNPQVLSEIEGALRDMPAHLARLVRAHVAGLQQLHTTTSELLLLLEHERDLHDLADPASGQLYLAAVARHAADLDATLLRLNAAWTGLHNLLLEHGQA